MLFTNTPAVSIPLLFLKVFGLYVSIQLIKELAGVHSVFSNRVCNVNEMTSCRKVLKSSAAKIAGISLSDLGFFYFSITTIFLLISNSAVSFWAFTRSATILVLPFTIFSIIYQWKVIKSWCPLCLLVLVVFWVEFIIFLQKPYTIPKLPSVKEVILGVSIIGTVVFLFYLFKTAWLKGLKGVGFQKRYYTFKNDVEVGDLIIEHGKSVTALEILDKMELGNPAADNELIMVTGPMCGPCMGMHRELEDFLEYFKGYLSVKIVPGFSSHDQFSAKVSRYMVDFLVSGSKEKINCINSWFRLPVKDEQGFEKWLSSSPSVKKSEDYQEIITWLRSNQINYTPCLILNKKIVNKEYRLFDLKKYLKGKLDE